MEGRKDKKSQRKKRGNSKKPESTEDLSTPSKQPAPPPKVSSESKESRKHGKSHQQEEYAEPGMSQQQGQHSGYGAWPRGPSPGVSQEQVQPSTYGVWPRGPSSEIGQQQAQPSTHGAWARGPPPGVSQQVQSPTYGAWPRGPTPGPSQQYQGQPSTQGAWSRGPTPGVSQQYQGQPSTQGAWPRGPAPGPSQQYQGQSPTHGAWPRGPSPGSSQQGDTQSPHSSKKSKHSQSSESPTEPSKKMSPQSTLSRKEHEKLKSSFQFAKRIHAHNKTGRPIVVATNHFPIIISNPNIVAYHYDVTIEPDKPKKFLREVWKKFVSVKFPGRFTAFDGRNAYSRGPLTDEEPCSATVKIVKENKEKEYNVTIRGVRTVKFSSLVNYKERAMHDPSMKILPEAEISVLEIILKDWASDNFVKAGKSFFSPQSNRPQITKLSEKLSLRNGFYQSTVLGYKPYLNFDLSHKAFYLDRSVLDVMNCFKNPRTKILRTDDLSNFLRGVRVEYKLPRDPNSRIYSVNKLVNNAYTQDFLKDDKTTITVAKYFEVDKKCRLHYPDLPLLWVGSRQKSIYVPMEFCRIIPDQLYKGVIEPHEVKEMVKQASSNAKVRQNKVYDIFNSIHFNDHPLMKEFGLKVSNEMEKVTGRILDPPLLKTSRSIQVNKGVWRINDFLMPVTLRKWCILNLDKQVRRDAILSLQNMLRGKGNELKMEIYDPIKAPIDCDSSFAALKRAFSQLKDMEMVLVIISEDKGVYSRVKVITETQEGILTQCVKGRTVSQDPQKLTSTIQNILLKINAKLGGRNHSLDRNSIPKCLQGNVMVIGADVTHSSPGMKIPSVAAVTVSCDPAAFQYSSSTKIQPKGEVIKNLEEIISFHLKRFHEIRKCFPDKIIFYRDGVSEGELETVFREELSAVNKACGAYCRPKVTFVIVQKRHHTRFFPTRPQDEEGKNFNVPVGTCVDTNIVHPRDLDFYLVSHASLLGTARPTRYRVIYDDNELTDDELEKLSFYLCHLFSRCNRSVSYPSPTYNAHLAAARVRAYLEGLKFTIDQDLESIQKQLPDLISKTFPMFFV